MRSTLSLFALAPALVAVTGCSQLGTSYPLPSSEVLSRLRASEVPLMPFGGSASDSMTLQKGDNSVVWIILDENDHELLRLVAQIAPGDKSTRVWTDVAPPEGIRHEAVAKGIAANPSIAAFYRAIAAEQVDSALGQRHFDLTRTYGPMMAATLANLPRLGKTLGNDAASSEKTSRDTMQRAYDDEAHGQWPTTQDAGGDNRKYGDPTDDTVPK